MQTSSKCITNQNVVLYAIINITSFLIFLFGNFDYVFDYNVKRGVYKWTQSCKFVHSGFAIVQLIVSTEQPSTFFKMLKTLIFLSQAILFCVSVYVLKILSCLHIICLFSHSNITKIFASFNCF